ncbi:MAG TPA: ABC transporter substrate-binding protein [Pseudolabrys sp.]|jgi:putative ABC transport system substrate-binding protein|nr:ABC transporter substrate-binding protein [Pseudolabrys sp.]
MRRRDFIGIFSSLLTWPVVSHAQQEQSPIIGFLSSLSEAAVPAQMNAFRRGLSETGFVEGRNVKIEYRWAEGHYERLPSMASEFVRRPVSLILGQGPPAALAAKAATASIPIVFVVGFDPVGAGLVTDLNNPGGNATGMSLISSVLGQKRLEMVRDLLPKAATVGMLVNPVSPDTLTEIRSVQTGAQALGLKLVMFNASTAAEIDAAFDSMTDKRLDALLIGTDPFLLTQRAMIVLRAGRLSFPTVYPFRDFTVAGGLMSYGASIPNSYRQAGIYAGKILKGANPAELPVMQPVTFELVINLNAAAAMGIDIPATLHARSDEVIE